MICLAHDLLSCHNASINRINDIQYSPSGREYFKKSEIFQELVACLIAMIVSPMPMAEHHL